MRPGHSTRGDKESIVNTTALIDHPASEGIWARIVGLVRSEVALARLAIGLVALHVLDDRFLQPNPGTSATDHLVGGLLPTALLVAGAVFYGRVRAGLRATIALALGFFGVLAGTEAAYYTKEVGPSGDDYTGLLSLLAGLALLGLGAVTLWRSRKTGDPLWRRYGRRALILAGVLVVAQVLLLPTSVSYVITHVARAHVPEANLGTSYEQVELTTSDGLRLRGWYVPSKNGAAVISFPGRTSSQSRARMLARHAYGVLLFDRRGEGESDGDPNLFGWQGERDIRAAVAFLQRRPDVDPERIGGIGLSVGGEMMIEAAAESPDLKAIVSEGGSGRSVRDILANPDTRWPEVIGNSVATAATALFTDDRPPEDLLGLVPKISGATFFVYGEEGQPGERPANEAFYAAARGPKELWEVPGSGHMKGIEAQPAEYERRVVGFFDRALLSDAAMTNPKETR
jgi:dienelactone hydrolase